MNNNFFDRSQIDDLDNKIQAHMQRPTLVSKQKKAMKKKKVQGSLDWAAEWDKYWYVYIFLGVSALFTGTLGAYMGLAPYLTEQGLYFQIDLPHIFLALVYIIAFITVTEVAFALAKRLFFTREEKNDVQKYAMLGMMIISGLSILGTGIAGGMVIASNISFMTEFSVIPDAAQTWVVIAIPVLITIYTALVSTYHLSSDYAASERITLESLREQELDNIARMRAIDVMAAEQLSIAEITRYIQLVDQGKISAGDARAAIRAGRTLGQEELRQNRDIDGYGGTGVVRPAPVPVMATQVRTPVPAPNGHGPDPSQPSE